MKKNIIKIIIAAFLFILGLILEKSNYTFSVACFIVSYLIVGAEILIEAIEHIFKGKIFDENFLMSLATIGAFAIKQYPEAVAVMLFYQIGEFFQDYAVASSKKSVKSLLDLRPDNANVIRDEKIINVSARDIKVDEIIVVAPGERVPLDGEVIEGNTNLDTKALTGESIPKSVEKGDIVLSGCINLGGLIKIRVTTAFEKSTVSRILDMVENASERKANSEGFITRFAKVYIPIVFIAAAMLFLVPLIVVKDAVLSDWLYRALTFLVVSCPCALVMSVPLSFFSGIGCASKNGILIKGSNFVEVLADIKTIIFDKTGTLTHEIFEVIKIKSDIVSEKEPLSLAAHAEYFSNYPISIYVKNAYKDKIDEVNIQDVKEISGQGISAKNNSEIIFVGNEKLMKNMNIKYSKSQEYATILYVARKDEYLGYIAIADKIKSDIKSDIIRLKSLGVKKNCNAYR